MSRSIEFDIVANDKATGKLSGIKSAMSDFGNKIGGMFAATALLDRGLSMATQGFSAFLSILKNVGNLNDAAKAAGLTTAEYQKLSAAAAEAGLEQTAFMKGLKAVKEFIRDAQVDNSKQSQTLKVLGYTQAEVTSGNIDAMEVMLKLSGAVEAAETAQQKYNVAAAVLGTKAQELVPLLDGMRGAMARVSEQDIIPQETIDKLDEFDKKIGRIQLRMKSLTAEVGSALLSPAGGEAIGGFLGGAIIPSPAGRAFGSKLGGMLGEYVSAPGQAAPPPSASDVAASTALQNLGATGAAKSALGAGGVSNITSAQGLGMATSLSLAQAQTSYLATIAANTAPAMGGAITPGSTNFTLPIATQAEVDETARNIRYRSSIMRHVKPAR